MNKFLSTLFKWVKTKVLPNKGIQNAPNKKMNGKVNGNALKLMHESLLRMHQ